MAFQMNGGKAPHASPMVEINTTPLVDVMLVLLVIFLITAPLLQQAVPIELPRVEASKPHEAPRALQVNIDAAGAISVDGKSVDLAALSLHLRDVNNTETSPELHLHADRGTRYERVAEVMATAQSAGITKIAFVTEKSRANAKAVP